MTAARAIGMLTVLLGISLSSAAEAALIQLRSQCSTASTVVLLGDLAEIRDTDPATVERLSKIVIQPAPGTGRNTHVHVADVKSRLQALGENLAYLEFRGASIVDVQGPQPARPDVTPRFSNQQQSQAEQRVEREIQRYLDGLHVEACIAVLLLPPDAVTIKELLSSNVNYWRISGGQAPWTGRQTFQIHTGGPESGPAFEIVAELAPKPRLLVLRHAVAQGHLITFQDLAWMTVAELPRQQALLMDPRAVVGQEAARALAEGRALTEGDVKKSPLVKRGDTVTVYSRCGAVSIKTIARANDEGAYGDQIQLRTLDGNTPLVAKVVGFHIAEITPDLSRPGSSQPGLKVRFAPAAKRSLQPPTLSSATTY